MRWIWIVSVFVVGAAMAVAFVWGSPPEMVAPEDRLKVFLGALIAVTVVVGSIALVMRIKTSEHLSREALIDRVEDVFGKLAGGIGGTFIAGEEFHHPGAGVIRGFGLVKGTRSGRSYRIRLREVEEWTTLEIEVFGVALRPGRLNRRRSDLPERARPALESLREEKYKISVGDQKSLILGDLNPTPENLDPSKLRELLDRLIELARQI